MKTLLQTLASKLEGYGVEPKLEYMPLVVRGRDIAADVMRLAARRLAVFSGGPDPLTLEQLDAELHICEDRMLELLAAVEKQANADALVVTRAVLSEVLAIVLQSIV